MVEFVGKQQEQASGLTSRLARNMAQRRKDLKLTQAQVAERLDVEIETLSRFERGKHLPSLMTLERISQVLGTTVADLLADEIPPASADAQAVEVWLKDLGRDDRDFALQVLKRVCDHLSRRGQKMSTV